jgi:hypothetical protein
VEAPFQGLLAFPQANLPVTFPGANEIKTGASILGLVCSDLATDVQASSSPFCIRMSTRKRLLFN